MTSTIRLCVIAAAALGVMASRGSRSEAALITYTETTTGSGSLGGVAYNNALVTLTAVADTADAGGFFGFFYVSPVAATVSVAGLGSAAFTSSTFGVFDNQFASSNGVTGAAGLSDLGSGTTVLGTFNAAFQGYDLTSSIGPLSGANFIRPDLTFATTSGAFALTSARTATFQATLGSAVPEPASLALCEVAGAMALAPTWRRRRRAA